MIEAARPDYAAEARLCTTVEAARDVWHRANRAGHVARDGSDPLSQELRQIADDIARGVDTTTGVVDDDQDDDELLDGPDDDGIVDVEVLDDEPPVADAAAEWPAVAQPGGGVR